MGQIAPSPETLLQALADETRAAEAFCILLERERAALIAGDLDQVQAFAQEKLTLGANLKRLAELRKSLVAQLGNGSNSIDWLARSERYAAPWTALKETLVQAQEANRVNGLLIDSRLAAIGNALAALRGEDDHHALYARDGRHALHQAAGAARWSA